MGAHATTIAASRGKSVTDSSRDVPSHCDAPQPPRTRAPARWLQARSRSGPEDTDPVNIYRHQCIRRNRPAAAGYDGTASTRRARTLEGPMHTALGLWLADIALYAAALFETGAVIVALVLLSRDHHR